MLTKEMEDSVMRLLNRIDNHDRRVSYLGSGITKNVYALDRNYVIKVETYTFRDLEQYNDHDTVIGKLFFRLKDYLDNGKQINKVNQTSVKRYQKFLSTIGLEESLKTAKLYVKFRMQSSWFQNVQEYMNYLAVKDTPELVKFLPKSLGILILENRTVLVQERGSTNINFRNGKFNETVLEMVKNFKEHGIRLRDYSSNNFVEVKKNKFKLCDTGICNFTEYKWLNNYWLHEDNQ